MNLYKISQDVNDNYDTYDSAVVVAETEDKARKIHPSEYEQQWDGTTNLYSSWTAIENVQVEYIGIAALGLQPGTIICSSFNAG